MTLLKCAAQQIKPTFENKDTGMKFSRALLPIVIATSFSSFTQAYQFETSVAYSDYYDGLMTSTELIGTYYFSQVSTDATPLAEAAFLGKNSSINLSYFRSESDDFDGLDSTSVSASFFIPNSIFFVGVGYEEDDDENNATLNLGITPVDGLLITTQHDKEADEYNENLYAKYVILLNGDRALNLEAAVEKNEGADRNDYLLLGDFYFSRYFSLGAAFSDDEVGNTYGLTMQHFFADNASIKAEYYHIDTNTDYDEFYDNFGSRNIWSVALSLRF
jgi:Putative general bacterial porin